MHSDKGLKIVIRGQITEKLVQSTLWKYGYSVERMPSTSKGQPYDLLLDGETRIEVKSAMLKGKGRWNFMGKCMFGMKEVDVFAFVFLYPDNSAKIRYIKSKDFKKKLKKIYYISLKPEDIDLMKSPLKAFGTPKRRLRIKSVGKQVSGKILINKNKK